MNFQNIKYFLAIRDEGNITKAANKIHVSQQSLSEQLKKLENELGVKLINRGTPVTLTPAGEVFYNSAKQLVNIYDDMLENLAVISGEESNKIRLAIPATETPPFLPELLKEFAIAFPDYKVRILKIQPMEAASQARNFDLYFSTLPLGSDLAHELLLETGTYAVAIAASLARAVYRDKWPVIEDRLLHEKKLDILYDMPFILLHNKSDNIVLDQKTIFQDAGFVPNISFQSDNSELNSNMCVLGVGAYVTRMEYCRRQFQEHLGKEDGILLYPLETSIDPVAVALSYRKGSRLSKASKCFIRTARNYLQDSM